ncbi:MAG: insulinase family protein, partial [Oscillospiraceae bacterium]
MQRKEIMPDVFINTIDAAKFKQARVSIYLIMPSVRETATALAVLPAVMGVGYKGCPTLKQLGLKLAKLYGATLGSESATMGANRIVNFSITGIKDDFAANGENLTAEYLDILFGSVFDPVLKNGVFDEKTVKIEIEKEREALLSEINDKRSYCLKQARRKFYGDSPCGIEKLGYIDDLDSLTPKILYDIYCEMLKTARIEVMVMGTDSQIVEKRLTALLEKTNREPQPINETNAMPKIAVQNFTEDVDAVQGKLAMVFTAGEKIASENAIKATFAVALFGSLPTSRLFVNVREKKSLCYYCSAGFGQLTGVMTVDSGVEHKNAIKTQKAVLKEFENLKNGKITDREMQDTRTALQTSMVALQDSMPSLESWYFGEIMRGSFFEPNTIYDA